MVFLGAVVVGLVLFALMLLTRIRGLEERVARLEGPREDAGPYRSAPARSLAHTSVGSERDDPEILEALRQGNKILAIKRYRQLTGAGLKEAKDAVEAMQARGA